MRELVFFDRHPLLERAAASIDLELS